MGITTNLPGLNDEKAVGEAHGIARKAGLSGLFVLSVCYAAMLAGLSKDLFAIPLFLSLCWCITMLGMTLLLDARRATLTKNLRMDGFATVLVISFSVSGTFLCVAGATGALMACWNILAG